MAPASTPSADGDAGPRDRRPLVLASVAAASVAASPVLFAYELILGVVLVAVGLTARRRRLLWIGMAVLAGPALYLLAWGLTSLVSDGDPGVGRSSSK